MIEYLSLMDKPVLPESRLRLLFTNGHKCGLFWFEEIELFLRCGGSILNIHYALVPDDYKPCLKPFITEVGALRAGSASDNFIGKLLINSLYGRLGLRSDMRHFRPLKTEEDMVAASNLYINNSSLLCYKWSGRPLSNVS